MSDPTEDNGDGDLARDPVVVALIDGLLSGKRIEFWGEGDVADRDEPRIVMWMEHGRIRMQGRGGVDYGGFGNGDVVWRFMAPILTKQRGAEG